MASFPNMDFSCPVCLEVYKDPVVLSCSHSFCKACLKKWWTQKVTRECPVCTRRSSKTDPPCNLVLKNLCETFSQQLTVGQLSGQPAALCPQHKEKLQLFCVDHQQLVCLVCRDSRAHHKHRFSPIDEVAQDYKEQLRQSLEPLQKTAEDCSQTEVFWDGTAEHIKQQGQRTERLIQEEFDKMRAFLQKEEQARIRALRAEVQQKIKLMERSQAALKLEKNKLSDVLQAAETQLRCDDISFLQNHASAMKRVNGWTLNIGPLPCGTLVDVAKHLGNLGFNIWNQMKDLVSYTPVVLDPNTANIYLLVSDDLQSAHYTETDTLFIDNPDRIDGNLMVLGSEGFSSGVHSWQVDIQGEVDVNDNAGWAVGVVSAGVPRNKSITSGSWEIWLRNGKYTAYAPPYIDEVLAFPTTKQPFRRIRMDLDWDRGQLKFSDPQTDKHIYTFRHVFTEKLYPFVSTSAAHDVKILPLIITVNLEEEEKTICSSI